jgi:hypothetical protein
VGEEVAAPSYTREERQRYREKVRQNLDVLAQMVSEARLEPGSDTTGMEVELNLIDEDCQPRFANAQVLEAIADPGYQTELARYNIELNVPPAPLSGDAALGLEDYLAASLAGADAKARAIGARLVTIGILPTIMPEHFEGEWISDNTRYAALNDSIFEARGEDAYLDIEGPSGERLTAFSSSIGPESACTSMQLHLQVGADDFAAHWNAAQALAGPQLALGANSPFLFGRRLHAETRIALFTQATDTRSVELKNQGVRPRVFFGERWITSPLELFEENVRYFPALLADVSDEDPVAVLAAGQAPDLPELRLHNGTVYRWNRPVYDCAEGLGHLRVENRVLPAGPTIVDAMANAAFYFGAVRVLARQERPVWTQMGFDAAEENFARGARDGMEAALYWPGVGEVAARDLLLSHLLPMAHRGLEEWGVSRAVRERYLGVVEGRCATGRNGARWQSEAVGRLEAAGADRANALRQMLERYVGHMHANSPVHTWPLP